jgi:hypothetical protein
MGDSVADDRFNDEQRAGLTARQFDQDRTLAAMHSLEAALPRRHQDVRRAGEGLSSMPW